MRVTVTCAVGLCVAIAACAAEPDDPTPTPLAELKHLGEVEQEIINGAQPARGSLAGLGVVRLNLAGGGLCSGTLLTNIHVLTARHCVRAWTGAGYGAPTTPINVTLEGATAADDQVIASNRVFEPNTTTLNAGDYAIIELASAMRIGGNPDNYFRALPAGGDGLLAGANVLCAGYGNNTEATLTPTPAFGAGAGTLRQANFTIAAATGGTLTINRTANQVGAPGDSGSTCFIINGGVPTVVIGPQSTCGWSAWADVDGNGVLTNNSEWSNITGCTFASPGTITNFVRQNTMANVTVFYTFLPFVNPPNSLNARVVAVNRTEPFDARSAVPITFTEMAARGGRLDVVVDVEPDRYMCQQLHTVVPTNGAVNYTGRCMSDALLPVILG